jgi:hypothetical protein
MRLFPVVLVIAALAVAGCGSSSSSTTTTSTVAATTASASTSSGGLSAAKFVLHTGLAFGAFHRYIYNPIKAGDLQNPLSHKLTVLKATAAAAFMVHEIKLAVAAAQGSPALLKLVAPLSALAAGVKAAVSSGTVSASTLATGNSVIESIKTQAAGAGASIVEKAPAIP